jgi:hypothetical protein
LWNTLSLFAQSTIYWVKSSTSCQIGLFPDEKVEVDLYLKDDFKETNFYRNGFILLNKKS